MHSVQENPNSFYTVAKMHRLMLKCDIDINHDTRLLRIISQDI